MDVIQVVVPLMFIALTGVIFGKLSTDKIESVHRINLDLFVPVLVIFIFAEELPNSSNALPIVISGIFIILGGAFSAVIFARILKMPVRALSPVIMFNNSGNIGLPLMVLTFGSEILPYAVILFILQIVLHFSLGILIFSGRINLKEFILNPIILATAFGYILYISETRIPQSIHPGMEMLAQIAIPLTLVTLGIRLSTVSFKQIQYGIIGGLLTPLSGIVLATLIVSLLDISEQYKALIILFGALPPAVLNAPLAEKYNQSPELVVSMVTSGNILSIIVLSIVLNYLL